MATKKKITPPVATAPPARKAAQGDRRLAGSRKVFADVETATITDPGLMSIIALNELMRTADLQTCEALMAAEIAGRQRRQFIRRLHCRLNRVRAAQERAELMERFK